VLKNENSIFDIRHEDDFTAACLSVFRYQATENAVYRQWLTYLGVEASRIQSPAEIPFLPISFFKRMPICCGEPAADTLVFTSSSTTGQIPSSHYVKNPNLYERSYMQGFEKFYGPAEDMVILALLPNYLQRQGSSLVYMVSDLIKRSRHAESGFYLDDLEALKHKLISLKQQDKKVLLIGVTYALLDLAEMDISLNDHFMVMETGGMKGRREEMVKEALHEHLKKAFQVNNVHSEYGMTELLSQAYSKGDGLFEAPPWMRFVIREIDDPLQVQKPGKTGGINVIDLANIHSCSFIATQDLGKLTEKNHLQLMGRFDHSDIRGCNLMVAGL
jgi:phenylacetate-coenzyme A ligase PaaK-like adenylate-forming protein